MKNEGVMLYAFNNERMDYVRIARYTAHKVRRLWNLPVCLVTDENQEVPTGAFEYVCRVRRVPSPNKRVYPDYEEALTFYNADRCNAWWQTPFKRTIIIDVDFIPYDDALPKLWSNQPLLMSRTAHSLTGEPLPNNLRYLGRTQDMSMYWATIVMFDRSTGIAQHFFERWADARLHYRYYADLFGFDHDLFRNDFAASIAMHQLTGYVSQGDYDLPYSIPTAMPDLEIAQLEPLTIKGIGRRYGDCHIMHKKSLLGAVCSQEGF